MRISDWSSDVCSSDLHRRGHEVLAFEQLAAGPVDAVLHHAFAGGDREWTVAGNLLCQCKRGIQCSARFDDAVDQAVRGEPWRRNQFASEEIGRASCRERVCPYV